MFRWRINVKEEDLEKKYCLLRVYGALDSFGFADFEEALHRFYEEGYRYIALDCKELLYINTSCLGTLMGFALRLQDDGGDLRLINIPGSIRNIIDLLGFTVVFPHLFNKMMSDEKAG